MKSLKLVVWIPTVMWLLVVHASPIVAAKDDAPKRRPNIVWIVGENLKLDLGCYGASNVKTPYLDRLAATRV